MIPEMSMDSIIVSIDGRRSIQLENGVSQVLEGNVEGGVFARVGSGFQYELNATGEPQCRNGFEVFRLAPDSFS